MKRKALMLAVTVLTAAAAALAGGAGSSDRAKLQGKWELTGVRIAGSDIPAGSVRLVLTFQGDKVIAWKDDKKEEETTYTLDETKKPRHLTVARTAKEKEMRAVYQVDGDTLKIAVSAKGTDGDRPGALDGPDAVLLLFKRVKK